MSRWFPIGKEGAKIAYESQEACEAGEGQACYDIADNEPSDYVLMDGVAVLIASKKAARLAKEAAESAKAFLGPSGKFLLSKFQGLYSDLNSQVLRLMKNMCIACKTAETVGGAAVEEFLDPRVKPFMHVIASMHTLGAIPVTIMAAKAELGKIVITFSADPSNDHKITYKVCL